MGALGAKSKMEGWKVARLEEYRFQKDELNLTLTYLPVSPKLIELAFDDLVINVEGGLGSFWPGEFFGAFETFVDVTVS